MAISMKLQAALIGLLLPLAVLAAPSVAADQAVAQTAADPVSSRDNSPEAIGLTKRANVNCYIVNASTTVNCRSGPGTSYPIVGSVKQGVLYTFQCYLPGTCYENNCTWDRINAPGGGYCYVNGYYTDANCSKANLGLC
ncbi:hypothetical protein DL95DRAFT_511923 [Leptodontidium sp. 2 PMI_412]|nr:hypothetical protein BKA61DRAFT_575063 [Leptodontidium sp. MPI-SDFR-AT-0119]KAH9221889.1 hypothetical protein DL95DRAFT_511923 [Leptodontidium sp. 2 PMI_412]